jgi:hypothetical protein
MVHPRRRRTRGGKGKASRQGHRSRARELKVSMPPVAARRQESARGERERLSGGWRGEMRLVLEIGGATQ